MCSTHVPGTCRSQENVSNPQELELDGVVNCPICVLQAKPGSFAKGKSALKHRAYSPAPERVILTVSVINEKHPLKE